MDPDYRIEGWLTDQGVVLRTHGGLLEGGQVAGATLSEALATLTRLVASGEAQGTILDPRAVAAFEEGLPHRAKR